MKFIRFFTDKEKEQYGKPAPAKTILPDWYKHAESTYTLGDSTKAAGVKKCMPFVDAMMSGYVLKFPFDVEVSKNDSGEILFSYPKTELGEIIHERPKELGATIPRPVGFAPNHLAFSGYWGMRTPKGFSLLVTHPLNRSDLPFHTISAIMDSDEFFAAGNIPFFIKEDFTGVIPEGTPIAQVIPIKRESWVMLDKDETIKKKATYRGMLARMPEFNYKKTMWHRKEYN
jgi:hypothetical protein